ncbi:hypothetical protein [uncultured Microbacterium sp.]|uniref:hypothetical protein n=1 Tax=uncultured Microbacterium sp. TaxID=191216 RepID=UPI0025D25885|nr:hypothetical protein [uncultured Microbacterium sp.]
MAADSSRSARPGGSRRTPDAHDQLDELMRSRLGAHLAGLLAAAASPLTAADLSRLTGRPRASLAPLLEGVDEIRHVDAAAEDHDEHPDAWALTDPETVARVVRNLHIGPMRARAEYRASTRELALAPFRSALLAALESARTEWGWDTAPEFALSAAFARSMHARRDERRVLVAALTDPERSRLLEERHPDSAREQLRDAAEAIAATAGPDLVDIARLLLAAHALDPTGGAVPRRLAPVFALLGDTDRAEALAQLVRTDVPIELAYVACAAAHARDPRAEALADETVALLGDGAPGALLRTAQAIAGVALYASSAGAHRLAATARRMVEAAFAEAPQHETVADLRTQQFRASRDQEWALGATTLATASVAAMRAGGAGESAGESGGAEESRAGADADGSAPDGSGGSAGDRDVGVGVGADMLRAAEDAVARIADDGRRAVVLAEIAARFAAERGAANADASPAGDMDAVGDRLAEEALTRAESTRDAETLVVVARLLAGTPDGPGDVAGPEPDAAPGAAPDAALEAAPGVALAVEPNAALGTKSGAAADCAARAARRALEFLADPDRDPAEAARLLLAASRVLPAAQRAEYAVPAARAVVAAAEARLAVASEPRSTGIPAALAEAAAVFDHACEVDEARMTAHTASEALARVPAPARAMREAEVAAALLDARDDEVFAIGCAAAAAEQGGTAGRWDAAASELVVATGLELRHPLARRVDLTDEIDGAHETNAAPETNRATNPADPSGHGPMIDRIIADGITALRRHDAATQLTDLADKSALRGDHDTARTLATHALRAARVRDPLLRDRAAEAVAEARAAARDADAPPASTATRTAARTKNSATHEPETATPTPLDPTRAAEIAASWIRSGYPLDGLAELMRADPAAGARIVSAIERDLAR